jgi:hypothetical protein
MRLLYSSTSLAFTQLVRLTLDRESIGYFCSDADSSVAGIAGPMAGSQSRIYVLNENDWEHAVELMRGILPATKAPAIAHSSAKPMPTWLVVSGVGLLLVLVVAVLAP